MAKESAHRVKLRKLAGPAARRSIACSNPDNGSTTIESLRAAKIVGRELRMQLV